MSIAEQIKLNAVIAESAENKAKLLELAARVEAFEKKAEHQASKTLHLKDKPRG